MTLKQKQNRQVEKKIAKEINRIIRKSEIKNSKSYSKFARDLKFNTDGSINKTNYNLDVRNKTIRKITDENITMYKLLRGFYVTVMDDSLTGTIDNEFADLNRQIQTDESMPKQEIKLDVKALTTDIKSLNKLGGVSDEQRFKRNEIKTLDRYLKMIDEVINES